MRLRAASMIVLVVMLACGQVVGESPALAAEGTVVGAGAPDAIPGRFIVTLRKDAAADAGAVEETAVEDTAVEDIAVELADRYGGRVLDSFDVIPAFTVTLSAAEARRLAANPKVASVEQDRRVSLLTDQVNAPWGLDRIDQAALPLTTTYSYPSTASNVHAYVIDTGVRITHAEFGGRASNGYDFVDDDAVAEDCNGHGTHVAGTIGGQTYGVAKGVAVVAVRVLGCDGNGSYAGVIAGINWVTTHAVKPAVANMSVGGPASTSVDNAVKASIAAGITYAVAAGNANVDACTYSPARTAEAITVGATDTTDTRASFSNYGGCLDIFAPGVSIRSSYNTDDTASAYMSGTSMASPHVAGAAALLLAAHPTATPSQIRDSLVSAATQGVVLNAGTGSPTALLRITSAVGTPTTPTVPVVTPPTVPVVTPPTVPVVTPPAPVVPCNQKTNGTNITIRDRGTATSAVSIGCAGKPGTAVVEVHIVHPRRGDLTVELIGPNGQVRRLKAASTKDRAGDVNTWYSTKVSAKSRKGTWKLRVRDQYKGYSGYIDSWTITV